MDNYSNLNRTGPVSSATDRVWEIQKKRRTSDQDQRQRKKKRKDELKVERKERDRFSNEPNEQSIESLDQTIDAGSDYGSSKSRKRIRGKVDVTV